MPRAWAGPSGEPSHAALARVDAALGLEVPDVLRVVGRYPAVDRLLRVAYDALLILMSLAVMVPPLCGDMRKSKEYVLSCFFAAAISLPVFAQFQAIGPWAHYHFPPSPRPGAVHERFPGAQR